MTPTTPPPAACPAQADCPFVEDGVCGAAACPCEAIQRRTPLGLSRTENRGHYLNIARGYVGIGEAVPGWIAARLEALSCEVCEACGVWFHDPEGIGSPWCSDCGSASAEAALTGGLIDAS